MADLEWLTPAECRTLGIPADPGLPYDSDHVKEDNLLFYMIDALEDERNPLYHEYRKRHSEHDIAKMLDAHERHLGWLSDLDQTFELPRAQLLAEILKGNIRAFCKNTVFSLIEEEDLEAGKEPEQRLLNEDAGLYVDASMKILRADCIDWQESNSTVQGWKYENICIETSALLECFPEAIEREISVRMMGNVVVPLESDPDALPARQGRKPLPWAQMHQELGRRAERGALPEKKEALIADLREWCRRTWGREVSRAAIQGQLRDSSIRQK